MSKKYILLLLSASLLSVVPTLCLAINFIPPSGNFIDTPANIVLRVLDFIWPIIVGIVIVIFVVAGFLFLIAQGDPSKIKTAQQAVIWGVVGIIVILLAFSIITIIQVGTGIF